MPPTTPHDFDDDVVAVCALGASAGGVKALSVFFRHVQPDLDLAYVVIVHLDPTHPSALAAILAEQTAMCVEEVHDSVRLMPNCVYLIPPDRELVIHDNTLTARALSEPRGQRALIDLFFRSFAHGRGDGLAVILSGAGSDGSNGVRAVKEAGGVILVQDPSEAEYPIMPQSAIATGVADIVAPIDRLAERVGEIARLKHVTRAMDTTDAEADLRAVVNFLRVRTGHDFANYKRATLTRRVMRRMQVTRQESLVAYHQYLRENVEEAQLLFSDLLISVTQFFRDADAFATLAREAIAPLFDALDERRLQQGLRVWVVGCATGEEAYSLAILLLEEVTRRQLKLPIQIFATDLDEGALATAREARYPSSIEADVSEERLRRFFAHEGMHYRIRKEVRDLVLFASHSALKDPPFMCIDLVSCRNLMIYLERELQRQLCVTLHYALSPTDGYLFLGSAETADLTPELFRPIDRDARLYRAKPQAQRRLPMLAQPSNERANAPILGHLSRPTERNKSLAAAHGAALERTAPPSALVDEEHQVLHLSETVGRFIAPSKGVPSMELTAMVRSELRLDLKSALHRAFERNEPSATLPVVVAFNGDRRRVIMNVAPVPDDGRSARRAMVYFLDNGPSDSIDDLADDADDAIADSVIMDQVRRLHEELRHAHERLSASRREHDSATQELRAANEELQSINEEYRSTSEELETSKEELQSINEELQTVNAELKTKLESISSAHSDLQNLIAATEIGTLFLDTALRVKLFTPAVARLFNITNSDIGRLITDFTHNLAYDGIEENAANVLRELVPSEQEVATWSGAWYLLRLRPYRTIDNHIDGVVVSFVDITARRQAEERLRASEARFRVLIEATAQAVWETDADGVAVEDSRSWRAYTGQSKAAWLHDGWCAAVHPDDQEDAERQWREAVTAERAINADFRLTQPDGGYRWTNVRASPYRTDNGTISKWVGMNVDITERKEAEQAQQFLLDELDHRVKNTLTVVQSLAQQSRRSAETVDAFLAAFEPRITALAAVHSLLTHERWSGANLRDLLATTLATYVSGDDEPVLIDGPAVRLSPKATITLGLGLNELATNALKHGALSVTSGRVTVRWAVQPSADGANERLVLTWGEEGGPQVTPPTREGFGMRLLRHVLPRELNGVVTLDSPPAGIVCTIALPLNGHVRLA